MILLPGRSGEEERRGDGAFPPADVSVSFNVMPFVWLSLPQTKIDLVADPIKGRAATEVNCRVTTNSRSWFIDCQATKLVGEEGAIPAAQRLRWEWLDPRGRVIETGRLDQRPTVASGTRPVVDMAIRLRFVLEVGMDDHAGTYRGHLTLAMRTND